MSLISRNIQNKTLSRGLGNLDIETSQDLVCEEILVNLEANVITSERFYPLTGTYAGVEGWKWNKSIPQNLSNIYQRIESSIGGYLYNLEEGTVRSDWYGGVLSGIDLVSISEKQDITKRTKWIPEVSTGTYSIFFKEKKLNSKGNISEILKTDSRALESHFLQNTIQLTVFKRDSYFNNIPFIQYVYSETFEEKYSFKFENNNILLNNLYIQKIGSNASEDEVIQCQNEYFGFGNESREIVYTEYYPIDDVSVISYLGGSKKVWTEVDSFLEEDENSFVFILNKEAGKISFPKKASIKKFYIKHDNGDYIEFFEEIEELNPIGKMHDGISSFTYKDRSKYKVYCDINRAAVYSRGDALYEKQLGQHLSSSEELYASYTIYPRLDVEVIETTFSDNLNLKPYKKINSNGILELNIDERNVNKLILSCDKPLIVSNIFGEMFLQSDSTKILAEALNANGKPVNEIKVSFFTQKGSYEGQSQNIGKVTNLLGLANTTFNYEYTDLALSNFVNANHILNDTYFELPSIPPGILLEDITLFQVLKTDPHYGSLGRSFTVNTYEDTGETIEVVVEESILESDDFITSYDTTTLGADKNFINRELCLSTYYNYGLATLFFANDTVSKSTVIRNIVDNKIILEKAGLNEFSFGAADRIVLYKKEELKFNLEDAISTGKSFDHLIYEFSESSGSYKPLRPSRIEGRRIFFDNVSLPKGTESESNIIAGYKIFCPELVTLYAECVNPATGRIVRSNDIKIKVNFPLYFRGKSGFKFKTDEDDAESGLGGSNFITINPEITNKINIFV